MRLPAETGEAQARVDAEIAASGPPGGVPLRGGEPRRLPCILYVIDQLRELGGGERALLEITRRLDRDRFRCSIVTFQTDPSPEFVDRLSCPLHILPLRRTYDFQAVRMGLQLRRLIRREGVSIVHTFFETSDLWAAPIAKLSGCSILVSSRRDMGILRTRKHHLAYPVVNRFFDRILTVSDEVRSHCIHTDHARADRVATLYNGVDIDEISAKALLGDVRRDLGVPVGAPIITTVANIRSVKGLDVLVRAASRVHRRFPRAVFLVVGRAMDRDTFVDLQSLAESLGIRERVIFAGEMSNPYPAVKASDCFCLPSRNEGFSNALIEAMACGVPSVATRVGGNAEAIREGVTGYLVESEDDEAMADRLIRLLDNPEMARKMGTAAREDARARFGVESIVSRLMAIYEDLLAEKNV